MQGGRCSGYDITVLFIISRLLPVSWNRYSQTEKRSTALLPQRENKKSQMKYDHWLFQFALPRLLVSQYVSLRMGLRAKTIGINCPPRINCVEVRKDLKLSMEWDLGSGSVPQVFVLQTEDLGFIPRFHVKQLSVVMYTCNHSIREKKTGNLQSILCSKFRHGEFQVTERSCLIKIWTKLVESIWEMIPWVVFWSSYEFTFLGNYRQTYTCTDKNMRWYIHIYTNKIKLSKKIWHIGSVLVCYIQGQLFNY